MAQTVYVAARLDQGQPAVETFAEFVWACGLLGYQHPDLTAHIGQVHDWYATEDGLDLNALDGDCAALAAAAASTEQALRLQDDQLTVLAQAWQGNGAQAAREFLLRHSGAAQQAVAAVRRAADTVAALRDQLYRAVDSKVAATERIAERCAAQRDTWLAAARTVRTGLGDRDAASELIDARVKPFVDADIGTDWVAAMRSATTAVSDAYSAALVALTDRPVPVFEIPGDLGPSWTPRAGAAVSADLPVSSPRTVSAGFVTPGGSDPAPVAAPSGVPQMVPQIASTAQPFAPPAADPIPPSAQPVANPAATDPASGWGSPLGSGLSGAGLSGAGSGLSGIGQQLADLFGGLIGSTADGSLGPGADTALPGELDTTETSDAVDDTDNLDESDDGEDEREADEDDDEARAADDAVAEEDVAEEDGPAADDRSVEEEVPDAPVSADMATEPAVEPQPAVTPPVAPAEPLVAPADKTRCEIAAEELPQVGG